MRALVTRIVWATAMMLAIAAPRVRAEPVPDAEAQVIQEVVIAQLAAFADDDADGAFETATPAVREAIGAPGLFLALVRGAYPMVYRPATVTFQKPQRIDAGVIQLVEITDSDAHSWLALFVLEQQPDASWRISGCAVRENRWKPV